MTIATGNPDLSGMIDGTYHEGINCSQFEGKTLKADSDVYIGGSCAFDSESRSWIQKDYKDGYGDWTNVVKIPMGTNFTVKVTNQGDLRNVGEVQVTKC